MKYCVKIPLDVIDFDASLSDYDPGKNPFSVDLAYFILLNGQWGGDVDLSFREGRFYLTGRHRIFHACRQCGFVAVNAMVESVEADGFPDYVQRRDFKQILKRANEETEVWRWETCFFARPFTDSDAWQMYTLVRDFWSTLRFPQYTYDDRVTDFSAGHGNTSIAFKALFPLTPDPMADRTFAYGYMQLWLSLHARYTIHSISGSLPFFEVA